MENLTHYPLLVLGTAFVTPWLAYGTGSWLRRNNPSAGEVPRTRKRKRPQRLAKAEPFRFGRRGPRGILYRLLPAPGESPPLVEGPVPLNEVGPPAVPLGPP
jgi:hypothetical protein